MTTTSKKAKPSKDLERAATLMKNYSLMVQNRTDLVETIMEELKGYEEGMKATEKELIEIGGRNMDQFDEKGNLHFEDGYLHIAHNTVVLTKPKFDLATFAKEKPDLIDIKLKTNPIKKVWLEKSGQTELRKLGVQVDTEKKVEVKLSKKAEK